MLPDQTPYLVQPRRSATLAVLKRDLTAGSWDLDELESRYEVVRFSNADRCLRYIDDRRVALVLLDADASSKELFRAIRARHAEVPILCVTGSSYPADLVEARARDYQFHTFALDDSRQSLLAAVDSLISPREHQRVDARECFVELPTESGSYAEFRLLDISNQGCAFEASLDPNGNPFVPNSFFPDIRIRNEAKIVLSGVGARVRNVHPLGSNPPGSAPRFRVGVAFTAQANNHPAASGEILDREIDILALLTNALTRSPWHLNLPFLETQGLSCRPLRIDAASRRVTLEAGEPMRFDVGDVVSVSVEIGGTRYSFYSAVEAGDRSVSEGVAFSVRLPSTVKAETHRSSMRYRPEAGQVTLTFQSPFGHDRVQGRIVDITSRGAGFIIDPSDCFRLCLGIATGDDNTRIRIFTNRPPNRLP